MGKSFLSTLRESIQDTSGNGSSKRLIAYFFLLFIIFPFRIAYIVVLNKSVNKLLSCADTEKCDTNIFDKLSGIYTTLDISDKLFVGLVTGLILWEGIVQFLRIFKGQPAQSDVAEQTK